MSKQRVLVVGGGFGGVKAALELADSEAYSVTLLSDSDELRYYPTLYHSATGGTRSNSSIPLQRIFQDNPIEIVRGKAVSLDRKTKVITTEDGLTYPYDILILALGVVTNYFNIPGLQEYAYSIKTQDEAERFKAHLHKQLIEDQKPDLNYVIVGGGPTGIELSGVLGDYIREIMTFHNLPKRPVHIDLVEGNKRLLPRMPRDAGRMVARQLRRKGVKLYLGSVVQGATANDLTVSGKPITSHTIVWTAGVTNNPFFSANNFILMNRGKVAVDVYLQSEPDIFIIGDNANTPYSGLAQTALHDGLFVAKNLKRRAKGKSFKSYVAKNPISVIPAGDRWAAVTWGGLRIYGWLGWVLREAADLIGFHDLEPWNRAGKQWMTEFSHDHECVVCKIATQK